MLARYDNSKEIGFLSFSSKDYMDFENYDIIIVRNGNVPMLPNGNYPPVGDCDCYICSFPIDDNQRIPLFGSNHIIRKSIRSVKDLENIPQVPQIIASPFSSPILSPANKRKGGTLFQTLDQLIQENPDLLI
ncbi:hypothetical protein WA158_000632 [Blastocystis sp. Blastoise]